MEAMLPREEGRQNMYVCVLVRRYQYINADTVMVHFLCQLNWTEGFPGSWLTLFLGVSVRLCLEKIAI